MNTSDKCKASEEATKLAETDLCEFWRKEAQRLNFCEDFHTVQAGGLADSQWFLGGTLNASVNCLDRHVQSGKKDALAIVWENEAGEVQKLTYGELLALTCDIAATLHERGVGVGDRVAIYLPMIPQAVASMLACARLGAIHTVVFGGFSHEALAERIFDAQAKAIITAEKTTRKGQPLHLRAIVDKALADKRCASVTTALCFGLNQDEGLFIALPKRTTLPEVVAHPPAFAAEHPLFILYTSGTTGKPKGLFHSTAGYLAQVVSTTHWVFDLKDDDLYWCTADVGWITGHSYVTYGPLALGKTIFMYDGALNYPDNSRIYQLIDKHRISVLYTAPTAIRMFMQAGEQHKKDYTLSSLRLLGSVGEPINPEAWNFYHRVFGQSKCPIIDSWWQTETGAMMIVPIPFVSNQKPGSATKPFFGISAKIVDDNAKEVTHDSFGYLIIDKPWPSIARGIFGDRERFLSTYFQKIPGVYFTGDGAKKDVDGDFTISGRIDDVVNVSGHRLGTAEVESALVAHKAIAEAAVVGVADELTGQRLVAFVMLRNSYNSSLELAQELKEHVKVMIGSFARPSEIYFEKALPKTRSGKIMRRLLRAKASGEKISSDISTLDDATALSLAID